MSELERPSDDTLRDRAITILKKRRDFHAHLLVYVLFNAGLVVVWATATPTAFFWPVFPLAFWGIGVVMNAWDVYVSSDITEQDIDREISRMHRR